MCNNLFIFSFVSSQVAGDALALVERGHALALAERGEELALPERGEDERVSGSGAEVDPRLIVKWRLARLFYDLESADN
jgi:hypothetical protein